MIKNSNSISVNNICISGDEDKESRNYTRCNISSENIKIRSVIDSFKILDKDFDEKPNEKLFTQNNPFFEDIKSNNIFI